MALSVFLLLLAGAWWFQGLGGAGLTTGLAFVIAAAGQFLQRVAKRERAARVAWIGIAGQSSPGCRSIWPQKDNRSIVQYTAVHAIRVDTGTTMRPRYHARLAQCHPTSMKAVPITASCPASTP